MRNCSLVEVSRAENVTGLKSTTEAAGSALQSGRGALPGRRSRRVNACGALGSENAGMSSDNADVNSAHRKPKVSYATLIVVG